MKHDIYGRVYDTGKFSLGWCCSYSLHPVSFGRISAYRVRIQHVATTKTDISGKDFFESLHFLCRVNRSSFLAATAVACLTVGSRFRKITL